MTTTKERGRIINSGMGGFLNPPTHPEHTHSVQTDLRRRPWNRGGMSLTSALKCEWLDESTIAVARAMLDGWQRPPIDSPEIQEWILKVLGYFKGCYRGVNAESGKEWHAANLEIDRGRNPLENANDHAGVHLIRQYYPEFVPTAEHFAGAYWGNKPA